MRKALPTPRPPLPDPPALRAMGPNLVLCWSQALAVQLSRFMASADNLLLLLDPGSPLHDLPARIYKVDRRHVLSLLSHEHAPTPAPSQRSQPDCGLEGDCKHATCRKKRLLAGFSPSRLP